LAASGRHTLSSASDRRTGRWVTVDQQGLVERARGGDHDAFAALVHDSIARLDSAARLILRDAELARDAVQEALMRAWRDLPGLRDPDRFDAWLHRLLTHACIDAARRRRRQVLEIELSPDDSPFVNDPAGLVADRDLLDRALGRLQPEARALVVLHHYLGLSMPEAADALGIQLGTAKSRLSRTLDTMRASVDATPTVPRAEIARRYS
jgi:RNA polymerase sigma-70 factor (ECF subfamily)